MPGDQLQPFFDGIAEVERFYRVAHFSVRAMASRAASDPSILHGQELRPRDLRDCLDDIDRTYVIRLFAEFEGALRRIYTAIRRRPHLVRTKISILMQLFASALMIPGDVLDEADRVREYRNALVHDAEVTETYSLTDCCAPLNRMLSYAPRRF